MAKAHQLDGVIAFLSRDAWKDAFEEVMTEHLTPASKTLDRDFDGVEAALGTQWTATVRGSVFEDFPTRSLEPDGRNLVEDYLKKRGFQEAGRAEVAKWLKSLENASAGFPDAAPLGTYDMGRMWRELGIEALRR